MDQITIRRDPANDAQGPFVIKVLINGNVVPDDDYCLNIESFFNAVDQPDSPARFLGGCGIPECCEEGYMTWVSEGAWCWGWHGEAMFKLSWASTFEAASTIISELERLKMENSECQSLTEHLPSYRHVLSEIKSSADKES